MGQDLPLTTRVTDLAILATPMDVIVRVVAHDETLRAEQNAKLEAVDRARKDANNLRQQRRRARLKAEALARTQNFLADVTLHGVTELSPYSSSSSPLGLTTSKEKDRGREKKPFRPDQRLYAVFKDTHTPDFVEDAVDQFLAWVQRERFLKREWSFRFTDYLEKRRRMPKYQDRFRQPPAEPLQEEAAGRKPGDAAEPGSEAVEPVEAPQTPEVQPEPEPAPAVAASDPVTVLEAGSKTEPDRAMSTEILPSEPQAPESGPERLPPWSDPNFPMDPKIRGIFSFDLWERSPKALLSKYGITLVDMAEARRIREEFEGSALPAPEIPPRPTPPKPPASDSTLRPAVRALLPHLHEDPAWICDEFGVTEADIVEARAQQVAYRIAIAECPKLLAAWEAQYG